METTIPRTIHALEQVFAKQGVLRSVRTDRYESGDLLDYEVRGVCPAGRARARFEVERYVGGGYAGQVYRVRLASLEPFEGRVEGLEPGRPYALKIFVPASGFRRRVRGAFYGLGFQAPFSLQCLAAAGRSQALWQKLIRRAAACELDGETSVVDIHGTFLDGRLGSYGEISEWVDGRMWRLEVDDNLDARRRTGADDPGPETGSPEYLAKRRFQDRLVRMLHGMGAGELARQYEWWSLKSQPNALKRTASDPDPRSGLVAVDFRAGMALLPFLPECPADFKLIARGIRRGRLVQFDRGDVRRLEEYVAGHSRQFADLGPVLEELKPAEKAYRESLFDITHHHLRLLGAALRRTVMAGFREGWRVRNLTDDAASEGLAKSGILSFLFLLLGLAPLVTPLLLFLDWPGTSWWKYALWALPLFGPFLRRLWGRRDLRRHYGRLLTSRDYFGRAVRAHIAEALIRWVRSGRVSEPRALAIARAPSRYLSHLPLSALPAGVHRFLSDKAAFRSALSRMFVRPFRLYFKAAERERWLTEMIAAGEKNGLLDADEAARILEQIREPFIQKYLKSLAVHLATLFLSETVFLTVAVVYVLGHPELGWSEASLRAGVIIAALNLLPVSPGSLVRGFYVVGLCLKEKNFRDYALALPVSFLKMIGYLAFPLQMAYRYPDLARFMAGHWATEAVHRVPVFGEKGAWLEHFVFDAFYNFPLTLRRRLRRRAESRAALRPRWIQAPLFGLAGTIALAALDYLWFRAKGAPPLFKEIWWLAVWVPVLVGSLVARGAGGMTFGRRWLAGTLAGGLTGLLYALANGCLPGFYGGPPCPAGLAATAFGHFSLFAVLAALGAAFAETRP